jgi:hypothetical protein
MVHVMTKLIIALPFTNVLNLSFFMNVILNPESSCMLTIALKMKRSLLVKLALTYGLMYKNM